MTAWRNHLEYEVINEVDIILVWLLWLVLHVDVFSRNFRETSLQGKFQQALQCATDTAEKRLRMSLKDPPAGPLP